MDIPLETESHSVIFSTSSNHLSNPHTSSPSAYSFSNYLILQNIKTSKNKAAMENTVAQDATSQSQTNTFVAPVARMRSTEVINSHTQTTTTRALPNYQQLEFSHLLPTEIRSMIWACVTTGRVVIVDHALNRGQRASQENIIETYPELLGLNNETREIAKTLGYTSIFTEPTISQGRWRLNFNLNEEQIDLCEKTVHFPIDSAELRRILSNPTVRKVERYMNRHRELSQQFEPFASLHPPAVQGYYGPLFFNPELDTIYLRRTASIISVLEGFRDNLWSPSVRRTAPMIQHLAIELESLTPQRGPMVTREYQRYWTMYGNFKLLRGLQTLSLILLEDGEVITITIDQTGTLTNNRWTFSLDLNNSMYKEKMGNKWLGVTWNVTLATDRGRNLYQLAHSKWRVQHHEWEHQKRVVFADHPNVPERARDWLGIDRVHVYDGGRGRDDPVVVPGGNGKTYYGASRG